jgi:hypothetical protein
LQQRGNRGKKREASFGGAGSAPATAASRRIATTATPRLEESAKRTGFGQVKALLEKMRKQAEQDDPPAENSDDNVEVGD